MLKAIVEENADKKALEMSKRLLYTIDPLVESQLWYDRGYWQAMRKLVKEPEKAARQTKEQ